MQRALEKRLQRLQADLRREEGAAQTWRQALEARVSIGGKLRQMLRQRGVDPAEIAALRSVDEWAAELAETSGGAGEDDAAAPAAIGSNGEREAEDFYQQLARMALLHFGDGERPDPAHASLMEWHAWCLVTPQSPHHPKPPARPRGGALSADAALGSSDIRWRPPGDPAIRSDLADGVHGGACGAIGEGATAAEDTHPPCRTTASFNRKTAGTC
jgi:hypothetical protein